MKYTEVYVDFCKAGDYKTCSKHEYKDDGVGLCV